MDNRVAIWLGALAGAVAGGVVGYLYFTEDGQRLRRDLEPRLTDLAAELQRARAAAQRAGEAAGESWESVRHIDATLRRGAAGGPDHEAR